MTTTGRPLPSTATGTVAQLADFRALCSRRTGLDLSGPADLHAFSVQQPEVFWRALLDWSGVPWSGSADRVLLGDQVETARFFPDLRLNHAEVLLRRLPGVDDDAPALTAVHADRPREVFSRRALREAVERTATALAAGGLTVGDRVVLVSPNTALAAVAALAVTALGATLSTAAPDMGAPALLDRFEQVDPVLLVVDRTGTPPDVVARLVRGLPTLRRVLLLDGEPLPEDRPVPMAPLVGVVEAHGQDATAQWPRVPFDDPLFVMFSSGTTGRPKAIVHGVGGTLLEHLKEHRLHGDLRPGDTLYFHTTTAWMMWHWQLSALAAGAHVVVFDGPVAGAETLWRLVGDHGVTVFGTSPAHLQLCQDAGYRPVEDVDLSRLRTVMSTGAVLHDWQFDWVGGAVGPVPVQSISGGTDIIGCFVLGSPETAVRRGRCQARSLGLDVAAVDGSGRELVGRVGDLVCRRPFPSRPVGFLRDPDGSRFHATYFAEHPGMWTHGDLVDFDVDGTARLHGRSDGVLNVNGIRVGPTEVYSALRGVPQVADAMAVEQRDPHVPGSSRMVLLVVLRPGSVLDGDLDRTIRRTLRTEASAAHVPSLVVAVPELPHTHNGKRSETAARDALNGVAVPNARALRNPGILETIRAAVAAASGGADDEQPSPAGLPPAGPVTDAVTLDRLARIWCEVLGLGEAGPDDDLSDLGGTSRQSVRLLRRVSLELGVDVPMSAFAARPTLRGLATAVGAGRVAGVVRVPLLRPGVGAPVHVVADLYGQLHSYHRLVESLTTERPVHGLVPPVVDAGGARRAVAEVVEDTLSLLRTARPRGPYRLLGYSFGGLVAYEVAARLREAGETVAYLGLLDVRPPRASLTPGEVVAQKAASTARKLRVLLSRRGPAVVRARLDLRRSGSVSPEEQVVARTWPVFNGHRLSRCDAAVTYYLARQRLPVVGNTLGAWRRAAPNLLVLEVPGGHFDLLDQDRIGELAARVSATLT
ncbi:acetoacetate--CoA ligase [Geodermatophilus sp. TF02-6]|uniref:acetoacetate--CoA ligase n=1 Tax=Geodermatophilus sp. TF02-6 TaxID=2250575 RepID=UPI000DE9E994|nr:acetoacetate--CoA ligase [Geodermatophilus sp. TF02-6]RBY75311.1 acetoacetate--CoA ligase [Geodermatophilus sp. TF02-6]